MPFRILRFTETVDGATYTARTSIPKGARLMDILADTPIAWTANTAPLDIGDSDGADSLASGWEIQDQNGKALGTDAGSGWAPNDGGPYSADGAGKLYPDGDVITLVLSPTLPGGPTGRTTVILWFEPLGAGQAATVAATP